MSNIPTPGLEALIEHDPEERGFAQKQSGNHTDPGIVVTARTRLHLLTRNSAVAMAGGLVAQAIKFILFVYIARKLTSAEFGLVSFGIAVNAFVFVVANFGLPVFGTREVAARGYVSRHLLFVIAGARSILALLATVAAVGALAFLPGSSSREYLLVGLFGLSNIPLAWLFDWAFQGLRRLEVSALLNVLWQVLWLAFTWAGIQFGAGMLSVPVAYCISAFFAALLSLVWLRRTGLMAPSNGSSPRLLSEACSILRVGAPLGVGTMLITVLIWTDIVIVRLLCGEQAVGQYAAGNRAALAVATLSGFYVQGVFPFFSKAAETSEVLFQGYFQHAYDDLCLLFVPGAIWGIFNARAMIQVLFKRPEYLAGAYVFQIFQIVLVLASLNHLFGMGVLVAFHRDRSYQNILLATGVFFLFICPILTLRWGIFGAAAAALVSQIFSLACFLSKTRNLVMPHHLKAFALPCTVGLALGMASWTFHLSLISACALLLVGYSALVLVRLRASYGVFPTEIAT